MVSFVWCLVAKRSLTCSSQCSPLLATSTILFVLGTLNAWTSLSQVLQAFTSTSAHSSLTFSTDYWLNLNDPKAQLRGYTAVLAVSIADISSWTQSDACDLQNVMQNLVLIWRLLVVGGDWRWAIGPVSTQSALTDAMLLTVFPDSMHWRLYI